MLPFGSCFARVDDACSYLHTLDYLGSFEFISGSAYASVASGADNGIVDYIRSLRTKMSALRSSTTLDVSAMTSHLPSLRT